MKEVNEMMFSILFVSIISLAASARETAELNRVLAERYATLADLVYSGHAASSQSSRGSRPLRG